MKRWQLLLAVVFSSVFCVTQSVEAAMLSVSLHNGPSVPVPVHFVPVGGGGEWRVGTPGNELFVHQTGDGKIELVGALDPDPQLLFGAAVTDFGAPSAFSFTFILPLAPLVSNPSIVKDSFSGSVTNAAGSGVTVTALPPPAGIPVDGDGVTEVQVYTLSDNGGLTWKNVGLDLMPTTVVPLPVGNSGSSGSFNEGFIPTILGGPWTHMRADVNFRLTGGGDVFAFSGAKILVPEPGTLVLLWLALAGCCFSRRRAIG